MKAASLSAPANDAATRPDADQIRRALTIADPNILRLTLFHLTRDPALADMRTDETPLWAGALYTYSLPETYHAEIRERAFEWLNAHGGEPVDEALFAPARIRETMELFGHGPLSDSDFRFGAEEAAFEPFPRGVEWSAKPSAEHLAAYPVLIVGAGISGLAAAIHLEQLGISYTVIERQDDVGGTWNLNNYPEARVDSTSMIYQYKFEKRYPWSEFFASGGETRSYLNHCADKYNIRDKLQLNTDLVSAEWVEDTAMWSVQVQTRGQPARQVDARFIISASGLFSTPKLPDIPGIESFNGLMRHTTDWQDIGPLEGKRVAQIGTGASGAQVMPYIARHADHVTVFQRTANYVLPMEGYRDAVPSDMQWLFENVPLYWHWYSYGMHFLNAQLEKLQEFDPEWQAGGGIINERNDALRENAMAFIRERLKERPDLIEKMTPDYPPMARRPTVDNGWYDALLKPNVDLVTVPIDHVREDAIVTRDGVIHPCDAIVCAAGFATTRYLWPANYVGRAGTTLDSLWSKDGPRAHMGVDMPGFPNFFMFFGPSAQGRAGSFYSMAEMWTRYALKAIVHVIENDSTSIEVTQAAFNDFNKRLDAQNKKLLWESYGKGFYYLTQEGRSVVNSPWPVSELHDMLYAPDIGEYLVQ